jgi:uridine phosphorylase
MSETLYPILEFDPEQRAIIDPHFKEFPLPEGAPTRCVLTFFREVLDRLVEAGRLWPLYNFGWEVGANHVYELEWEGQRLLVAHPGVGAPLAAGYLEELIAMGVTRFVACGGCGVLEPEIVLGHPVVLTSAVRDEGTSYHYLPPGREVASSPALTTALASVLERHGLPFRFGKAWTTDAPYRETPARRALRMAEGCSVVEMEASAFFAVAQFRGVEFGQVVYGGDLVVPDGWDNRAWQDRHDARELLFWLSVEACLE